MTIIQRRNLMKLFECLETEAFNELITFSLEEVKWVFDQHIYFVPNDKENQVIDEATNIEKWYKESLEKIIQYEEDEYSKKINQGEEVPEFETPQYKVSNVETQTKRKLIFLISKYFDKSLFESNKPYIYNQEVFKEEVIETPHDLLVSLNVNKNRIYSLLSILGYYQRTKGYFISRSSWCKIRFEYSAQVHYVNKSLGMEYRPINIFNSWERIKPPKDKKSDRVGEPKPESYQSNKFIDMDKISLIMLLQPHLKYNTREINKIIEIMTKNFKKYRGDLAWEVTQIEVGEFISECESKGIMKKLGWND